MKKTKNKVFSIFYMNIPANKISNITSFANQNDLTVMSESPINFKDFVKIVKKNYTSESVIGKSEDLNKIFISLQEKGKHDELKSKIGL